MANINKIVYANGSDAGAAYDRSASSSAGCRQRNPPHVQLGDRFVPGFQRALRATPAKTERRALTAAMRPRQTI